MKLVSIEGDDKEKFDCIFDKLVEAKAILMPNILPSQRGKNIGLNYD